MGTPSILNQVNAALQTVVMNKEEQQFAGQH